MIDKVMELLLSPMRNSFKRLSQVRNDTLRRLYLTLWGLLVLPIPFVLALAGILLKAFVEAFTDINGEVREVLVTVWRDPQ